MPTRTTLQKENVTALRRRARAAKLKGYSRMSKAALVSALATSSGGKGKSIRPRIKALLESKTREQLYDMAATLAERKKLTGYSTLDKRGLASFIAKAEAGKLKPKVTQASVRKKMAAKKASTRRRYGKAGDAYRVILVKDGSAYGALGPYATARAAIMDGKRIIRLMVGKKYSLSQAEGEKYVDTKVGGGTGVGGIVPVPLVKRTKGKTGKAILDAQGNKIPLAPEVDSAAVIVKVRGAAVEQPDVVPPVLLRSNRGRRRNGRGAPADSIAAHELALFIENDGTLYRGQTSSIITNLAKKMAKGQFNRTKAVKLMGYLADSGGRKYMKEFGDPVRGPWQSYPMAKVSRVFSPATRRAAAAILLDGYMEAIEDEAASMGGSRRNGLFGRGARGASAGVSGRFGLGGRSVSASRNPRVAFQTKDGPVSFMAKKNPARMNGNKSIAKLRINANRWRDSYGNTYHRAYIHVNGRHVGTTPIAYGYGSQYLTTAKEWLKDNGYRKPSGRMSKYDAGYEDVRRKRDL